MAGGYAFARLCHLTRFHSDALEWEQNLFEAALWGLYFYALARAVVPVAQLFPPCTAARGIILAAAPFPYVSSLLLAVALALPTALLANLIVGPEWALRDSVDKYGGELLRLLQTAAITNRAVMVTMDSRKVYVGLVIARPSTKSSYTSLLPTISGYRNSESLVVTFTTRYTNIYEDLVRKVDEPKEGEVPPSREAVEEMLQGLCVVLPIAHISSATIFDSTLYGTYFEHSDNNPPAAIPPEATSQSPH